tara:strand:- start:82 stop:276 length:195 start_codon:yes stop_codon:yes gene_type:complete
MSVFRPGGSGGGGLTVFFQNYFINNGTVSVDGVGGDTDDLDSSDGVGGGAGGSIFIYSVNGTST